jgi:hypothetical protein
MAGGILAGTAGTATASSTGPAASTANRVMQPGFIEFGCKPYEYRPPYCDGSGP